MIVMLRRLSLVARQIPAALIAPVLALIRQAHHHRLRLLHHTIRIRLIAEGRREVVGAGGMEREGDRGDHTHRLHLAQILNHHLVEGAGRTLRRANGMIAGVGLLQIMILLGIRRRTTTKRLTLARRAASEVYLSLLLKVGVLATAVAARTLLLGLGHVLESLKTETPPVPHKKL